MSMTAAHPAGAALASTGPVAQVRGLQVSFPRGSGMLPALRGLDLEVAPGEILGLVGESGSGKSVLGLALLGLHDPARVHLAGQVRVCGVDLAGASAQERRALRRAHLGAVFQDPMTSLNPTMRIGRQVAEAAGSGPAALALLEAVGVPEPRRRLGAFPHELSGGLRQRVMIAMAVAGRPALVVADEPTTALDVTVQAQILGLLRRLRDETGTAFLLITHDLGVAAQVADRIAVLYSGRLMESGTTGQVLHHPVHPYTRGLLRSRLTLATERTRALPALAGEPPDPGRLPRGCAFAPRCPAAKADCTAVAPQPTLVSGRLVACLHPPAGTPSAAASTPPAGPLSTPPAGPLSTPPAGPASTVPGGPACAPPAPGPLLSATGLVKAFQVREGLHRRRLQALRGVDLQVHAGESVAVVGESGSGKSTLLRVLAGLVAADEGRLELAGPGAQMVFQDAGSSLTPWLTVGELLAERLGGLARRDRAAAVEQALAGVGLPAAVASARAGQLSGGQRQRVALARAVVVPPPLLLCDEPTSALDVSLAATVLNLLAGLRSRLGMAMVFVTHDLAVARLVADRIAVMYCGRVVETGPAEQVCTAPSHPYTQALLAAVPDLGRPLAHLTGDPVSPLDPPAGCAFHPRCPQAGAACRDQVPQLRPLPGPHPGAGAQAGRSLACVQLAPGAS